MANASPVQAMLDRYRGDGLTEIADLERLRGIVASAGDPWSRAEPVHLTASAFIVDRATRRVLMRWHERQGTWLQVGGHADPGETDPVAITLREAREESGLDDLALWADDVPCHVVIVPVPANDVEPAHEHADVRYVLATDHPESARAENDHAPIRWVDIAEAVELTSEDNVRTCLHRVASLVAS